MFEYENDLLIVDELYFDPRFRNPVIRIGESYYMLPRSSTANKPLSENELSPFKIKPAITSEKASYAHQFFGCNTMPRGGFKVSLGRAITNEELDALIKEYNLGEEDIYKIFTDGVGMLYGDKYKKTFTSIQIRFPLSNAIPIEQILRKKGIEAMSCSPGRVNIRIE